MHLVNLRLGIWILTTSLLCAGGQLTSDLTMFEVASIRLNRTGLNGGSINRSNGRITLDNVSLWDCVAFAYGIPTGRAYALEGPPWLESEKFDIVASFHPDTSREMVRRMMRTLLVERFNVSTHVKTKKLKAFVLVVGKGGTVLRDSGNGQDSAFTFGEGG